MQTTPVEQAIALLQNTQKQVYELLEPFSGLYLQADHLLTVLINGLIFTTQQTDLTRVESNFDPTPLVFGDESLKLSIPTPIVDTAYEEVDQLRLKAMELYSNFCKRESKDILEACNALEIRAVAKLAGINPMDHPEQIDGSFIHTIKEAITKKEAEQQQMDEWLAKKEQEESSIEKNVLSIPAVLTPVSKSTKPSQGAKKASAKK